MGNTVAETDLVKKCVREDHGEGVLGQVEVGQLGEKGCRQHELFQLDVMGDGQPLQLELEGGGQLCHLVKGDDEVCQLVEGDDELSQLVEGEGYLCLHL